MDKLKNNDSNNAENHKESIQLFKKEFEFGTKETFTSAFNQELQLLVRGEFKNSNSDFREALIFFVDPNIGKIKGSTNI